MRARQRPDAGSAVVGVAAGDDVEELRVEAVASVARGLEEAIAARLLEQRVRVRRVTELRLHDHLGAVDRSVLRILDVELVADVVAELEEAPIRRPVEGDRRSRVPDRDRQVRDAAARGGIGDGEPRVVEPVRRIRERGRRSRRIHHPVRLEVPGEGDRVVLGIEGPFAREVDDERRLARVGRGGRHGDRRALTSLARAVLHADELLRRIDVRVEAGAPLQHVERTVGAELDVDRRAEVERREQPVQLVEVPASVEAQLPEHASAPLEEERHTVVVGRELDVGDEPGIVVEDRAAAGRGGADALLGIHLGELARAADPVPHHRRLGRRQIRRGRCCSASR